MEKLNIINYSIEKIKETLIDEFGYKIKSAVLYGTANSDDFSENSDFDILLGFEEINTDILKTMKLVKEKCKDLGILVDFNSHSELELPKNSNSDFWHNNRGALFHSEIGKLGKIIIGDNPYLENFPTDSAVRKDVLRSISSIVYRMRKIYVNEELTEDVKYNFIKWGLYLASSALAYNGKFFKNKIDIINEFKKDYPNFIDIDKILFYKKNPNEIIPNSFINDIIVFSENLSKYFLNLEKGRI